MRSTPSPHCVVHASFRGMGSLGFQGYLGPYGHYYYVPETRRPRHVSGSSRLGEFDDQPNQANRLQTSANVFADSPKRVVLVTFRGVLVAFRGVRWSTRSIELPADVCERLCLLRET